VHPVFMTARAARRRAEAGFSLLEAVIAAGLLLMTVTAVTLCVANVSGAGARLERTMDADRAARRVAERLRTLPFCAPAYPLPAGEPSSHDLVGAVFPHAQPSWNTASARYVGAAGDPVAPQGSFVTLIEDHGVKVRCVAQFLSGPDGPRADPADVEEWGGGDSVAPPAPALAVELVAVGPGGDRCVRFAGTALARPFADPEGGAPG
jgi:hypothetical protein